MTICTISDSKHRNMPSQVQHPSMSMASIRLQRPRLLNRQRLPVAQLKVSTGVRERESVPAVKWLTVNQLTISETPTVNTKTSEEKNRKSRFQLNSCAVQPIQPWFIQFWPFLQTSQTKQDWVTYVTPHESVFYFFFVFSRKVLCIIRLIHKKLTYIQPVSFN